MPGPDHATHIRATHPYAFRSGQWARLLTTVTARGRDCYLVEFPDGVTDFWPVDDLGRLDEFSEMGGSAGSASSITPMTTLGEVAYLAWWREHEHGHGYDHDAWLGLPQRTRNAWEAAAEAVRAEPASDAS